jgi:hypothetical protein
MPVTLGEAIPVTLGEAMPVTPGEDPGSIQKQLGSDPN